MPQGKGTYGSQVGRPKKYKKGGKTKAAPKSTYGASARMDTKSGKFEAKPSTYGLKEHIKKADKRRAPAAKRKLKKGGKILKGKIKDKSVSDYKKDLKSESKSYDYTGRHNVGRKGQQIQNPTHEETITDDWPFDLPWNKHTSIGPRRRMPEHPSDITPKAHHHEELVTDAEKEARMSMKEKQARKRLQLRKEYGLDEFQKGGKVENSGFNFPTFDARDRGKKG